MKFFVGILFIAVFAVAYAAVGELEPSKQGAQPGAQQGAVDNLESLRIRKAARNYGAAPSYMPSIPCPKNYLFSCQPQLQPVPCAQQAYHQGAYSEPIAQWAAHPKEN